MIIARPPLTMRNAATAGRRPLFPGLKQGLQDCIVPALYGQTSPALSAYGANSGHSARIANLGKRGRDATAINPGNRGNAGAVRNVSAWRSGWRSDPIFGSVIGDVSDLNGASTPSGPFCMVPDNRGAGSNSDTWPDDEELGLQGTLDVWFYQHRHNPTTNDRGNPMFWSYGASAYQGGTGNLNGSAGSMSCVAGYDNANHLYSGAIFSLIIPATKGSVASNGAWPVGICTTYSGKAEAGQPFGQTWATNQWNHVALTWDLVLDAVPIQTGGTPFTEEASSVSLFVNGSLVTVDLGSGPISAGDPSRLGGTAWSGLVKSPNQTDYSASNEYLFGGHNTGDGHNSFNGWLGGMSRWDRALSASEIRQLYEWPLAPAYAANSITSAPWISNEPLRAYIDAAAVYAAGAPTQQAFAPGTSRGDAYEPGSQRTGTHQPGTKRGQTYQPQGAN